MQYPPNRLLNVLKGVKEECEGERGFLDHGHPVGWVCPCVASFPSTKRWQAASGRGHRSERHGRREAEMAARFWGYWLGGGRPACAPEGTCRRVYPRGIRPLGKTRGQNPSTDTSYRRAPPVVPSTWEKAERSGSCLFFPCSARGATRGIAMGAGVVREGRGRRRAWRSYFSMAVLCCQSQRKSESKSRNDRH